LNFTTDETSEISTNDKNNKNYLNFLNFSKNINRKNSNAFLIENSKNFKKIINKQSNASIGKCDFFKNSDFLNFEQDSDLSSFDSLDYDFAMLRSRKINEASSITDSITNSNCALSPSNNEENEANNFFKSNLNGKANLLSDSSNLNNNFNFSNDQNFEEENPNKNKDTSILFDNLIFSLCSNSNFNDLYNNNNIADSLDNNVNNIVNNVNYNSNLTDADKIGFNSNFPFEAEFYYENTTGFKFDQ
jgi:hypothetical protein